MTAKVKTDQLGDLAKVYAVLRFEVHVGIPPVPCLELPFVVQHVAAGETARQRLPVVELGDFAQLARNLGRFGDDLVVYQKLLPVANGDQI